MKKTGIIFIFAAVTCVALLTVSCKKEAAGPVLYGDKEAPVFRAKAEAAAEESGKPQKVVYSAGRLLWQNGDRISVYDASSNASVYEIDPSCAGSDDEGIFSISSGTAPVTAPYKAVYPASVRTGAGTVLIPAHQDSPDGSLQGLPMYAESDNFELKFRHLCGVVRFRLTAASSVSLSTLMITANTGLNGSATITGSGSSASLSTPTGGSTMIMNLGTAQSIASSRDFYMYLPTGSYSTFNITMTASNGTVCTKSATCAIQVNRGQITTITLTGLSFAAPGTEGVLEHGAFSVANGRTVKFSQGNLQYQASTGTWRFAINQYDYIGNAAGNTTASGRESQSGWIDLFGWGTSGWDNGNYWYMPYSISTSTSEPYTSARGYGYGPTDGSSYTIDLTGAYSRADWGVYNAISNGGNAAGIWRTPTASEWNYVFNERTNCSTIGGTSNGRYALAKVNGVGGMILFPDYYSHPAGVANPQNVNSTAGTWGDNNYSASDWTKMQTAGAVFLPAAGYRGGTSVSYDGVNGYYWTASYSSSSVAYDIYFRTGTLNANSGTRRFYGRSVRLVRD